MAGRLLLAALGCGALGGAHSLDLRSLSNADATAGLKKALAEKQGLAEAVAQRNEPAGCEADLAENKVCADHPARDRNE